MRDDVSGRGSDDVRAVLAALSGPDAPGSVSEVQQRDDVVQGVRGFTVG